MVFNIKKRNPQIKKNTFPQISPSFLARKKRKRKSQEKLPASLQDVASFNFKERLFQKVGIQQKISIPWVQLGLLHKSRI